MKKLQRLVVLTVLLGIVFVLVSAGRANADYDFSITVGQIENASPQSVY
jgi:heme/copper-type cytochrome/quinol oxidase subunit 3